MRIRASIVTAAMAFFPSWAGAQTRIEIMPPGGITIAAGQRFDLRVEATNPASQSAAPPAGLRVTVNGEDLTNRNQLEAFGTGERGVGGAGKSSGSALREVT